MTTLLAMNGNESDHDLLVRLNTLFEQSQQDIQEIKQALRDQDKKYVTKAEFSPVQRIVYGLVTLVLVAVVTAIVANVVVAP